MRTSSMCFSILRVPRSSIYCLVNTWWEGFDSVAWKGKSHCCRLLRPSACVNEDKSKRWSRRSITTGGDGRKKNTLSGAANLTHEISVDIVETTSTSVKINETDGDKLQPIDDKDLASLATFIVFDLETTGFRRSGAGGDRIIEIALKDLRGGSNSTFRTLVNPGREVLNYDIHGIQTHMVNRREIPRMEQLIPILVQYINSRQKPGGYVVLVAHNARTFDVPFLLYEFERCSIELPEEWLFLDTLPLAREVMKDQGMKERPKVNLQALRDHFKISSPGQAHRAMTDVEDLSQILQKITYELKLPVAELMKKTFRASELSGNSTKKKKDSS